MKCQDVRPRLGEWLDGQAGDDLRQALTQHLDRCADCRAQYQDLRRMAAALARAPEAPLPPGLWQAIAARLETGVPPAARRRLLFPRIARPALAAAAVLLIAVTLTWLAFKTPWEASAVAAEIDFRPLLEQAGGNLAAGVDLLLGAYGGRPIALSRAARRMKLRVHAPAELPGQLRLRRTYLLPMGAGHESLAFYFAGAGGELLLLQCPAGMKMRYGDRQCLPCRLGVHRGQIVRAGRLRLLRLDSAKVCICIVSTLDERSALPAALDAVRFDL